MISSVVTNLFRKDVEGAPMSSQSFLLMKKEFGIENDSNASSWSPRQVLIVRAEDLADMNIAPGALRENIVIKGLSEEDFRPGVVVRIGESEIRLTFYCEPCYRIADVIPSMKEVFHRRGILGIITKSGKISLNDKVEIIKDHYEPFSEKPYERFLAFIQQIPPTKVVTYKQIVTAIGVAPSTMRVIPYYIKQAVGAGYPIHRIVDTTGMLVEKYVPHQSSLLQSEGVQIHINKAGEHFVELKGALLQEFTR